MKYPWQGELPDYERPPVVETVLGVQFEQLEQLQNAHLGLFWRHLGTEQWPKARDAPLLEPQFEKFSDRPSLASRVARIRFSQELACRIQLWNQDEDRLVQLQRDRFHLNWLGMQGKPYPRYERMREEFKLILGKLEEFLHVEKLGSLRPNQWEITYLNDIPRGSVWNTPEDWSFFRPLASMPEVQHLAVPESFAGSWHYVIPSDRGRLHVEWEHVWKPNAQGGTGGTDIVRLTFTARGPIPEEASGQEAILSGLDLGRAAIVCTFKELMSPEANRYWGLKDAAK